MKGGGEEEKEEEREWEDGRVGLITKNKRKEKEKV